MTDINEKLFTSQQVAAIAGCREGTLRQWRSRHGLLVDEDDGLENKYFSLVDVCVARAVQVMSERGAKISDAVAATLADSDMRGQIAILLSEDEPFSTLFGFHKKNPTSKPAAYMFQPEDFTKKLAQANGFMIVLDVLAIVKHVRKGLKI